MRHLLSIFLIPFYVFAQETPHDLDHYNFIHYDENIIHYNGTESSFNSIYNILDSINIKGKGGLNIVHIGDSHIQADYFSGKVRKQFFSFFPGGDGSRGCIFPYDVAKTNNPTNYYTKSTGAWLPCKNVQKNITCNLGVCGMSISTYTENATLEFHQRSWDNYPIYNFDRIKVFHNTSNISFDIKLDEKIKVKSKFCNKEQGYTQFILDSNFTSIKLRFIKNDSIQSFFEFYGISLESTIPGITYSSMGVNGSDVDDWVRCRLFTKHLTTLNPELVIVSLGTNDGYMKYFSPARFEENLDSLISMIRKAKPDVPIILTTPGDNYRYRRYLNKNTEKTEQIILTLAKRRNCAVWNLYKIMGGQNSIILWHKHGLTANDKLHYSKKGYEFQGDLLFSAFMKGYDEHLGKFDPIVIPKLALPKKKIEASIELPKTKKKKNK